MDRTNRIEDRFSRRTKGIHRRIAQSNQFAQGKAELFQIPILFEQQIEKSDQKLIISIHSTANQRGN